MSTVRPARSRAVVVVLTLILAWSLTLRLFFGIRDARRQADWDERFNGANVAAFLATSDTEPRNGYYSTLSYFPQALALLGLERLESAVGRDDAPPFADARSLTRRGTFFVRGVQAVYGTLLVAVGFLLGRRLFGPAEGLLAAALLSSSWLFVWAGAWFKPDALATLTVTLALLALVRALDRPTTGAFVLVGVAVGLAVSAKLPGALVLGPVVAAIALADPARVRRAVALLQVALAAAATFFATSPYWRINLFYSRGVLRDYAWRAGDATVLSKLGDLFGWILGSLHGRPVAILYAVGAIWLGWRALRDTTEDRHRRVALAVLVVFPVYYALGTMALARTPFLRSNNAMPGLVPVALVAAAGAVEIWRRSASRLAPVSRRRLGWGAAALLALVSGAHGASWIYRVAVPSTEDLFLADLREHFGPKGKGSRLLAVERWSRDLPAWEGAGGVDALTARIDVDRLSDLSSERLDAADVEVFHERRLRGRARAFYEERMRRVGADAATRYPARFLAARGPSLVAVWHPWRSGGWTKVSTGASPPAAGDLLPLGELPPEVPAGDVVSVVVLAPWYEDGPTGAVGAGPVEAPLWHALARSRSTPPLLIGERFVAPGAGAALVLAEPAGEREPSPRELDALSVDVWTWSATGGAPPSPSAAPGSPEGPPS